MNGLTPETSGHPAERDTGVLLVNFAFRHLRTLVASTLIAGLATMTILLVIPRVFEGSAMLVLVPPKVLSDLKAASLTVQGYQKLLESDAVVEETRHLLLKSGVLLPGDTLRLRDELETRIFVSRYSEATTLAPMIQVVARAKTADKAAKIANTWAEVFLVRLRDLMAGSTSSQVKFVDEEYPKSRERLQQLESEKIKTAGDYLRRIDESNQSWDEKILQLKSRTADLLAAHGVETKKLTEELKGSKNMATRQALLQALRKTYSDLQNEQAQASFLLQQKVLQFETTRHHLSQVSAFLTLRKAVTDEALWRAMIDADGKDPEWKHLQDRIILSQEVNPVHRELAARLSQLEIEVKTLEPRSQQLEKELARISPTIASLDALLRNDEVQLEKITRDREAGHEQLQEQQAVKLVDLMRQRTRDMAAVERERDSALARLDRGIHQEKELNLELAKNFNQAILAKAQQSAEDVRLGTSAVPMDRPLPRGIVAYSVVASAFGLLAGLLIAWLREALPRRA